MRFEFDPNYSTFVQSRVKWLPNVQQDFIHASIGIIGEVVEYLQADSRQNVLEELGDLEFYWEHFRIAATTRAFGLDFPDFAYQWDRPTNLQQANASLMEAAGDLLDISKKLWVYEKDLKLHHGDIGFALWRIRVCLSVIHSFLYCNERTLQANNQSKLMTRYPNGYSNHAAQARADKQGEKA